MKKLLAMMLASTMTLGMLSGCGGESATSTAATDSSDSSKSGTSDAADTGSTESGETIKLGIIQPRSGSLAVSGEDSYWGNQIAVDMFNERGGVNGKMVEAVVADVPDQTAAQTEVNRLIQQEGVNVITGVYGSSLASVAGSVCNRNGAIYWENISVTDELTEQGYETVFRMHINGTDYGYESAALISGFLADLGYDDLSDLTVAIMTDNNDGAISMGNGATAFCEENNMNIVLNELYNSSNPDTAPVALQLKNADADVCIVMSYTNDAIDLTKQMKTLNWSPELYIGLGTGYGIAAYQEALGYDAEGIIDVDPISSPKLDSLDPEMAALVEEFQERYVAERGYVSPAVGYLCWQATWVLLNEVILPAGGTDDVDKMVELAKAIDIPEGTLPTGAGVQFDEKGQNQRAVLGAMQWQDGELVTVYPESVATADAKWVPLPTWEERAAMQ